MRKLVTSFCTALFAFFIATTAIHAENREALGSRVTFRGMSTELPVAPEIYYERADALAAEGKIVINDSVPTQERMHRLCDPKDERPPEYVFAGCTIPNYLGLCLIYVWADPPEWYRRAVVRLHEWPHCGGWPEGHPGGGTVRVEELAQCVTNPNCRPMFD